ncbi:MAG TPA: DUF2207 domain-containing protein [Anaerolineae bacterium]|nr:DUF2207 domain-containing protein [Anaerolineae bacterium]HQH38420.1 DUF2207 domain-containing protein [Anaerolineae bacterium]
MLQQLLLSFVALSLLFVPWHGPVAKSYSADRFDVDVAVQDDGSLMVTERLTLRFVGGPFTYVYRHLPAELTDGIDIISASVDGASLPEGKAAGQVEIAGRDPIKVTWHFAPTSDSTHTFDLTYHVWGAVRQESDADVLIWQALPDQYEYRIAASTIRVTYLETATLLGTPEVQRGAATVEEDANTVTFEARDLKPNTTLIVALRFGAGSLIDAPPQWQTRGASANQSERGFVVIAVIVVAFLITLFVVALIRSHASTSTHGETPLTLPPSALPPAVAGVLMRDGSTNSTWIWAYALGTCFDLAQRGVISIEEAPRTSRWQGRDFIFRFDPAYTAARPHERGLIEAFFRDKDGLQSEMRLSKLHANLYARLKPFSQALREECESLGFFDAARQHKRTTLLIWGFVLIFLSVALIVVAGLLSSTLGPLPVVAAVGVLGLGIVLIIVAATTSLLSEDFRSTAMEWKSFARYLSDVTRQRDTLVHRDQFEGYLPYAVAFGMAEAWVRYLKKHEDIEVPAWFRALTADDGGYGAFVALLMTGSSHGAGAAGAAGAAGGGASGAG